MPVVFQEKVARKLDDGRKALFHLWMHSDDSRDEDEGCFTCDVKVYVDGRVESEYYRKFLIRKYTKQHYAKFMDKFCTESEYREQFNIKHDKQTSPHDRGIDAEIKDLISSLNELGLKTIYSCQGTRDGFSDRPRQTDGHSILAYVIFQKPLPPIFLKLVSLYDLFLTYTPNTVYSRKRSYNIHFREIMSRVVEEFKLTQRL